jgi:hypothetical protein
MPFSCMSSRLSIAVAGHGRSGCVSANVQRTGASEAAAPDEHDDTEGRWPSSECSVGSGVSSGVGGASTLAIMA